MHDLGDLDWLSLTLSCYLWCFIDFSRLDPFHTSTTIKSFHASRLVFISLVPWIDKPWGYSKGRATHDPCACGIRIGALRSVNRFFWRRCRGSATRTLGRSIYLFGLTLIFIIAYTLVFLFVSLKAGGKS